MNIKYNFLMMQGIYLYMRLKRENTSFYRYLNISNRENCLKNTIIIIFHYEIDLISWHFRALLGFLSTFEHFGFFFGHLFQHYCHKIRALNPGLYKSPYSPFSCNINVQKLYLVSTQGKDFLNIPSIPILYSLLNYKKFQTSLSKFDVFLV